MKIQWAVTTWACSNKAGLCNDTAIKWHCGREYCAAIWDQAIIRIKLMQPGFLDVRKRMIIFP